MGVKAETVLPSYFEQTKPTITTKNQQLRWMQHFVGLIASMAESIQYTSRRHASERLHYFALDRWSFIHFTVFAGQRLLYLQGSRLRVYAPVHLLLVLALHLTNNLWRYNLLPVHEFQFEFPWRNSMFLYIHSPSDKLLQCTVYLTEVQYLYTQFTILESATK